MALLSILKNSLKLLYKEPKIFVPRFITTALYSLSIIYLAGVVSEILKVWDPSGNSVPDRRIIMSFMENLIPLIVSMLFLYFVDLFSYAMYPAIVKDHYEKKPISLRRATKEALGAWKILIVFIVVATALMGIFALLVSLLRLQKIDIISYLVVALLILVALVVSSLLLFFVLPVAVVEKRGVRESFSRGIKLSIKYKKEVLQINIIFLVLIGITYVLMIFTELKYSGILAALSILLFLTVRVFEAIIYTYISVVNPYFYMHIRKDESY
jgi:hypothetical protein